MTSLAKEIYWVSKDAQFPDTCIECGMYTDKRVKITHSSTRQETYESDKSSPVSGLGCLLTFLGPLGMLISLVMMGASAVSGGNDKEIKTRNVKTKGRIDVPQCMLCKSERKLQPVDANVEVGLFAFAVHKRFVTSYEALNGRAS